MNQTDFLKKLADALKANGISRVEEILADYQEHFSVGIANGKSEADISQKLGDPETIAKAYKTDDMIKEIKNPDSTFSFSSALSVLGRLIILAPFNFLVLSVPGAILFSMLVAGWAVAAAIAICGLALFSSAFATSVIGLSFWVFVAASSGSLSLIGFGLLIGFFMFFLSKYFVLACISYLQWNLKFILQK